MKYIIIIMPLIGTIIGSLSVLFIKKNNKLLVKKAFGFSAGVMLVASFLSLINPSINMSKNWFPPIFGILLGVFIILSLDLKINKNNKINALIIIIAIILHNIPEGISISVPIYYSKKSKKKAFLYTMISGLSEPLGALLSMIFLYKYISNFLIEIFFSLIAGLMSYISIFELMKTSFKYDKNKIYILYGSLFILIVEILLKI